MRLHEQADGLLRVLVFDVLADATVEIGSGFEVRRFGSIFAELLDGLRRIVLAETLRLVPDDAFDRELPEERIKRLAEELKSLRVMDAANHAGDLRIGDGRAVFVP